MHHVSKITFLLEEEAFHPDCSQRGEDCGSDDLPRLQVHAAWVDLPPALLQIQQDHLLIHLQGTLDTHTQTHTCTCYNMLRLSFWVQNSIMTPWSEVGLEQQVGFTVFLSEPAAHITFIKQSAENHKNLTSPPTYLWQISLLWLNKWGSDQMQTLYFWKWLLDVIMAIWFKNSI